MALEPGPAQGARRRRRRRPTPDAVVLGCDSVLDLDGRTLGQAHGCRRRGASLAGDAWRCRRAAHRALRAAGRPRRPGAVAATTVRFGSPTDAEIEAYVATGEPLRVAGAFTIDGLGGWFVDGVDGDPANVIGLSLPLLRRLLAEVGVAVTDLWCTRHRRTWRGPPLGCARPAG